MLIRNHAEAVIGGMKNIDLNNMIGHNFRLGEVEAAIGIEQIKKVKKIVQDRQKIANYLNQKLTKLEGLIVPKVRKGCTHSYYMYMMRIDPKITKVKRDLIFKALKAEGVPNISNKYQNLHLLPMFQKKLLMEINTFLGAINILEKILATKKGSVLMQKD